MEIIKITNSKLSENCYIINKDNKAVIIDPGIETDKILKVISEKKLKPEFVLLTHGNFDHIYSAKALQDMGAKVYITEVDAPKLFDNVINMGFLYDVNCEVVVPNGFLVEGKQEFLGDEYEVIFTPGHTSGSCCIVFNDFIFTGDTYFEEGVYGRTDLLDGDQEKLEKSIEKLRPHLSGKKVLAGHE